MKTQLFEIKTIHENSLMNKIIKLIPLVAFIGFILYKNSRHASLYDTNSPFTTIFFLVLAIWGLLKVLFPKWQIFRTFVHFQEDRFCYKVTLFQTSECILYSNIKAIRIIDSNVFIELQGTEIIIKLANFSPRLIHKIKIHFRDLYYELNNSKPIE